MRPECAFVLLPLLLFLSAAVSAADNATFKAGVFSPPRQAPDFSLRGSDGGELKLSRYRGKVVVLGFGFTSCPDSLPDDACGPGAGAEETERVGG